MDSDKLQGVPFDAYYTIGVPISLGQSMKPGIYATKKAIALITIAMVRMIRSSLSSGNMTQDGSISLEYTVAYRAPSES